MFNSTKYRDSQLNAARLLTVVAALFLTGAVLFTTGGSVEARSHAQAQSPRIATGWNWEINLDFEKGAPRSVLIVSIFDAAGDLIDTKETRLDSKCKIYGKLSIDGPVATFNRNTQDYISCDLPNLKKEVEELSLAATGQMLSIGSGCECGAVVPPWAAANIRPDFTNPPAGSSGDFHPLFYHPNFQYSVEKDAGSGPYANLNFTPMPSTMQRSSPLFMSGWHAIFSSVDAGFFATHSLPRSWAAFLAAHNTSQMLPDINMHWVDGHIVDADKQPGDHFTLTTDATTIYFGHNPDTGEYLHGEATHIGADPGCYKP